MAEEEVVVDAEEPQRSLIGRVLGMPMTLIRRPLLGLAFLTFASTIGALAYLWMPHDGTLPPDEQAKVDLQKALDHYDNDEFSEARALAASLRHNEHLDRQERWGPSFILGVAMAKDAEVQWDENEKRLRYQIAARYLDESRKHGFPIARQLEGFVWLGQSRYAAGRYAEAIPPLTEAVQLASTGRFELRRQLAQAYLRQVNPNLEHSLQHAQLELTAASSELERNQALVDIADLQIRLKKLKAATATLQQVRDDSQIRAWKVLALGRIKYAQALSELPENAVTLLRKAIADFREAARHDPTSQQPTRLSHFFRGKCFFRLRELKPALTQFAATRELSPDSDEGIAGAIAEAMVLREQESDEAMPSYRKVIRRMHRLATFPGLWIRREVFRAQMVEAVNDFVTNHDFAQAIELTRILPPLISAGEALQMEADAHRAWAEDYFEQASTAPDTERIQLESQARRQMRQAGQAFSQLANRNKTTNQYSTALWNASQSFLRGNDFKNAVRLTSAYLANVSRDARPRALVALARSHLALSNLSQSLQAAKECMEFHGQDPASYSARLIASRVYLQQGQLPDAVRVLSRNLDGEGLQPASAEFRDSLFALGQAHYLNGVKIATEAKVAGVHRRGAPEQKKAFAILEKSLAPFADAASALEDAIRRYPQSRRAIMATYLAADARRQAANYYSLRRDIETIEITRQKLTRQIQQELMPAVENFDKVITAITYRGTKGSSRLNAKVLRNSYFSKADALFGLERYAQAEQAYRVITERYDKQPITLEARVQLARCYRHLGELKKASGSIQQAITSLKRMKADANFGETTRYDNKKDWQDLLDTLARTYATRLTT